MLHKNKQWDWTQVSQLTLKRLLQYIQELIQHELIYTYIFHIPPSNVKRHAN